jgi:hypothetical protein
MNSEVILSIIAFYSSPLPNWVVLWNDVRTVLTSLPAGVMATSVQLALLGGDFHAFAANFPALELRRGLLEAMNRLTSKCDNRR